MPGGDRTGPLGWGPMTGRAAGYCAGYPVPGFMNPVGGRGYGFGFGFGRGFGLRGGRGGRWGAVPYAGYGFGTPYAAPYAAPYTAPPTRAEQLEVLQSQAEHFEKSLNEIKKRIAELEAEAKKE